MPDTTFDTAIGQGIRGLLSAQSAVGTKGTSPVNGRVLETSVYITWSTGTSAGAVTIETAPDINYSGTWAVLDTVSWSAADKVDIVQITGALGAIRARISTGITGGTVTVHIAGAS